MMKKITQISFDTDILHAWILLLRILVAAFMLTHGLPKFNQLMAGEGGDFRATLGMGPVLALTMTVFAEALCSVLIGLGLFTRLAAIPLIITMMVAAFIVHAPDPFGRKEMALPYTLIYTTSMASGSGKYPLDFLINKKYG
jgi:putative oxidoreductase